MNCLIRCKRTLLCVSADCYFRCKQSETKCQSKDEIDEQEYSSSVLGGKIRETPDISQTNCTCGSRHNKSELSRKASSGSFFLHNFSTFQIFWAEPMPFYCTIYSNFFQYLFRKNPKKLPHSRYFQRCGNYY